MIRWAEVGDAEQLAEVHVRTWQRAYEHLFPEEFLLGLDRGSRARWWRRFVGEGNRVQVAEDAGQVVGFCHADSSADEGWGEIFSIYVSPAHWGQGHGHALLAAGESTLLAKGHEMALLWVLEGNDRGRRFYERQRWTIGKPVRLEEIGGVQVTEVRYEKDLTDGL